VIRDDDDGVAGSTGLTPPQALDRRDAIAVLACTLLAAALRLYRLDALGISYDETFTIAHAAGALPALLQTLLGDVVHPPLHYVLVHAWIGLTGVGAVEARLVSVIAGVLSIPALYLLARRFTSIAVSTTAALLLATSQMAVYFSQEARPYMLAQLLSLAAAGSLLSLVEGPSPLRIILFAVASLTLMATHYHGIATLAALAVYILIFRRTCPPLALRGMVIAGAIVIAAYSPWLIALSSSDAARARVGGGALASTVERPDLTAPVMALNRFNNGKLGSMERESAVGTVVIGLIIFTAPIMLALFRRHEHIGNPTQAASHRRGLVLGCLMATTPVLLAILLGTFGAVFNYRHFSFAVPGYYLAVAIGWRVTAERRPIRIAWLAAALVMSALALRANYLVPTKPAYREALAPLAASYQPGDCAVIRPGIFNDRMHLAWDVYYRERGRPRMVAFSSVRRDVPDCERLWFVWDKTWWMNRSEVQTSRTVEAMTSLEQHFERVQQHVHPDLEVRLLRRRAR
jgi:4-amino-4-deoxy-L-arabinose transferase-like glycosyltransferase